MSAGGVVTRKTGVDPVFIRGRVSETDSDLTSSQEYEGSAKLAGFGGYSLFGIQT